MIMKHYVFITDPEGVLETYTEAETKARAYATKKGIKTKDVVIVSGGDISDKGPNSLELMQKAGEADIKIIGNRDANKIRFLELLDKTYVENFLTTNYPAFWDAKEINKPLAFLKTIPPYNGEMSDEAVINAYSELDFLDKQVIVAKWMLAKTMSAANAFEYRRTELGILLKDEEALDDEVDEVLDRQVVRSLIEEVCTDDELAIARGKGLIGQEDVLPDVYRGQIRGYLQDGKIMHAEGKCFFSHAGFNPRTFPFMATGEELHKNEGETDAAHFRRWVDRRNDELQQDITGYFDTAFESIAAEEELKLGENTLKQIDSAHRAVIASLPVTFSTDAPATNFGVISYNPISHRNLKEGDQNIGIAEIAQGKATLVGAGFSVSLSGHQPQDVVIPVYEAVNDIDGNKLGVVFADTASGGKDPVTHKGQPGFVLVSDKGDVVCSDNENYLMDSSDPYIGKLVSIDIDGAKKQARVAAQKYGNKSIYVLQAQKFGAVFVNGEDLGGQTTHEMLKEELKALLNNQNKLLNDPDDNGLALQISTVQLKSFMDSYAKQRNKGFFWALGYKHGSVAIPIFDRS